MNSILSELRRRNVFRVAAAYLVVGWLVMQIASTIGSAAGLPDWADSLALIILIAGFPVVLFIAWAFELTPEGMKKTEAADEPVGFRPLGPSDYLLLAGVIVVLGVAGFQSFRGPDVAPGSHERVAANAGSRDAEVSAASIAVLPFADLSPEGDQEYFSDGIAEEILNVLVRVEELDVTSRTSAFQFKGRNLGIPEIARVLNVRHVLEGSVRRSGDTLRITAQLIDAQTDVHLWSETYDRPLTAENVFAIQDEIAAAIVVALGEALGITAQPVEAVALTDNVDAYDLFLQARSLYLGRRELDRVMELLDQAIARDPGFAQAHAIRAGATLLLHDYVETDRTRASLNAEASRFARNALAIDPDNATALAVLANSQVMESRQLGMRADYADILAQFDRALEIDPHDGSARNWRALVYLDIGYLDLALNDFQTCQLHEPRYSPCVENGYETLYAMGRTEEAFAAFRQTLSAGVATDNWLNFGMLARFGEEIAFTNGLNMSSVLPRYSRTGEIYQAYLHLDEDHSELGADAWRHAASVGNETNLGVEQLLLPLDPTGSDAIPFIYWQTELRVWRQSDTFRNRIRQSGILDYWRGHGFPPQCRPVGDDDFECD
ncbi:MAG: hypothetical protein DHS20C06_16780 [Hyphobacterium sp.]|nr:MAG: hypothetical protein DHS20C06_16780 [Hyphobacterium sp.]